MRKLRSPQFCRPARQPQVERAAAPALHGLEHTRRERGAPKSPSCLIFGTAGGGAVQQRTRNAGVPGAGCRRRLHHIHGRCACRIAITTWLITSIMLVCRSHLCRGRHANLRKNPAGAGGSHAWHFAMDDKRSGADHVVLQVKRPPTLHFCNFVLKSNVRC